MIDDRAAIQLYHETTKPPEWDELSDEARDYWRKRVRHSQQFRGEIYQKARELYAETGGRPWDKLSEVAKARWVEKASKLK